MTYKERQCEAYRRYRLCEKPTYSTGFDGLTTAGYGELDFYGWWEFPLDVNQETFDIVEKDFDHV